MTPREIEAVVAVCLFAAFADGSKDDSERRQIKDVLEGLDPDGESGVNTSAVYTRVILKRTDLAAETAALESADARRLAYEMAVCVCDADGVATDDERAFLADLKSRLDLAGDAAAESLEHDADALAHADPAAAPDRPADDDPLTDLGVAAAAATTTAAAAGGARPPAPAPAQPAPAPAAPAQPAADPQLDRDADSMILKYAILCGALELLPQNLATLAVIPMQTKMVYRIGKKAGYTLDRKHITEFLGVLGVGVTSQVVENFARDLLGKALKKTLGKTASKVGKAATGPLMSFATTWALGQVAKQYYTGGRNLAAVDLRRLFQSEVQRGKQLYAHHATDVHNSAQTLDTRKVMALVRGQSPTV